MRDPAGSTTARITTIYTSTSVQTKAVDDRLTERQATKIIDRQSAHSISDMTKFAWTKPADAACFACWEVSDEVRQTRQSQTQDGARRSKTEQDGARRKTEDRARRSKTEQDGARRSKTEQDGARRSKMGTNRRAGESERASAQESRRERSKRGQG